METSTVVSGDRGDDEGGGLGSEGAERSIC